MSANSDSFTDVLIRQRDLKINKKAKLETWLFYFSWRNFHCRNKSFDQNLSILVCFHTW